MTRRSHDGLARVQAFGQLALYAAAWTALAVPCGLAYLAMSGWDLATRAGRA